MSVLKHMDIVSRNQRLRETLEGMGLFVLPIFCESDPQKIDYLQVSAAPPAYTSKGVAQVGASGSIVAPVPCAKVGKAVRPAKGRLNNVVNLPSMVRE